MSDRVAYLGHATVLLEIDGVRLLTDPLVRGRVLHIRRHAAPVAERDYADLDAILISHGHPDHLDRASLRRVGRDLPIVVPRGLGRLVARFGHGNVTELAPGERVEIGAVAVRATRAVHDGRRFRVGSSVPALGFLIEGGVTAYFAGDTDLFAEMSELGPLELALLPIAGWGGKVGPGHLDPERAASAVAMIRPRIAVPIHWGTLQGPHLLPRDLRRPAAEFERLVADRAPGVDVRLLDPGESTPLTDSNQMGRWR